nr:reverse transcriptase domain-containing protein [Tanacetum cinerariifolium]
MRTRSPSNLVGKTSTNPNLKGRYRRRSKQRVEPFSLKETSVVTMADQRTMAELLRAPTEGYAEEIIVPPIPTEHFELKHSLIYLVTSKQFFGFKKEDPHSHIRYFNKNTSTLKYKDDDLVSMFINHFFPSSKTTNLRNEISSFQQRFDESFIEAWDHFKDLLRACPHHSFTQLHQLDTLYNGLNQSDQDSLNSAAGGNLLERMKESNVDSSKIASAVASAMTSAMTVMFKQHQVTPTPAFVKAVEESYVTYGGAHSYRQCPATNDNTFLGYQDNIQGYVSAAAVNYNQGNTGELKAITTRSGVSYVGPPIPPSFSSLPKVAKQEPEVTKDTVQPIVDFDADPRVPLILGRSFLKTERALIDEFEGELTHRVGKEAITFNLDQTSRYSAKYNDMTANRIDVIDMTCEEYSQEVLGFSDVIASGNPTLYYDPIVSTSSLTLTPFRDSDFLLEEVDAFLALEDDTTSPEELKICEAKTDKSSIDEPLEVELKDLPPHIEYTFLEGDDKLPAIIAKDLSDKEKTALITDDFEPAVQNQRRVNPKIHDVIKKEVLKLLDAGLIYLISKSPWVSLVHYVPKKGDFTVVENEENELILTRLVTGWCVYIDYRKLNEATRKDHFPLPFMDQMLKRLAGNEYYCFLDGFSCYFQIPIDLKDQEKTIFMYPYGMVAYRRMPFGLCNAPGIFQMCMMAIFHDMIKKTIEVFMDDFSVFGNSFQTCLSYLEKMLKRCEDTNLCLN